TKIVAAVIGLLTLQGLWHGAGELVGLVVSTLLAVVFAPPLGRGFESLFNAIFRTGGMMRRGISIAILGVIITRAVKPRLMRAAPTSRPASGTRRPSTTSSARR